MISKIVEDFGELIVAVILSALIINFFTGDLLWDTLSAGFDSFVTSITGQTMSETLTDAELQNILNGGH